MAIWKTKWGWRARFMFEGRTIRAKKFFKYKYDAKTWINDEKKVLQEKQGKFSTKNKNLSLNYLSKIYLEDCKINFSKKTYDEKKYCLERFKKFVGKVDVLSIDPPTILGFINQRAKSQSNHAANKDRKNLKAFYSWMQQIYGIMYDPTAPIKKKTHQKKQRRLISIQDILRVMLAANGHDRVLIESYWHTGARKSEIFRWTWDEDINFEERWVRLGTKKSRTGEMIYEKLYMNDDLYKSLMWQWKNRHPTSPYVFCNMNPKSKHYGNRYVARLKFLKSLCETAQVEPFNFHDIRHTVAKYLNDLQKVGMKKVQQVLRHKKQSTTEIYVEGNYSDTKDVMKLLEIDKLKSFK